MAGSFFFNSLSLYSGVIYLSSLSLWYKIFSFNFLLNTKEHVLSKLNSCHMSSHLIENTLNLISSFSGAVVLLHLPLVVANLVCWSCLTACIWFKQPYCQPIPWKAFHDPKTIWAQAGSNHRFLIVIINNNFWNSNMTSSCSYHSG